MANDYIDQWDLNTVVYDIHDKGRGQPNGVATLDASSKVPDAQLGRGLANGVASLDSNGRIPYEQLPEDALTFKGYWDADTNSPTLVDGTGTSGDFYFVSIAGTQNLGSGSQYFAVGDRVLYDGSIWKNIASGSVRTINGQGPDAQGDISGVVKSVNGNTPDANGAVTVESSLPDQWKGRILNSEGLTFTCIYKNSDLSNDEARYLSGDVVFFNGKYYAVEVYNKMSTSSDNKATIVTSENLYDWTPITVIEQGYSTSKFEFTLVRGGIYLRVYSNSTTPSTQKCFFTEDGVTWTENPFGASRYVIIQTPHANFWFDDANSSASVLVSFGQETTMQTTNIPRNETNYLSDMRKTRKYLAEGPIGYSSLGFRILLTNHKIMYSLDGISWTEDTYWYGSDTISSVSGVFYSGSRWFIGAYVNSNPRLYYGSPVSALTAMSHNDVSNMGSLIHTQNLYTFTTSGVLWGRGDFQEFESGHKPSNISATSWVRYIAGTFYMQIPGNNKIFYLYNYALNRFDSIDFGSGYLTALHTNTSYSLSYLSYANGRIIATYDFAHYKESPYIQFTELN